MAVAGWQEALSHIELQNILNIQHFFSVRECEKFIIPKRINFSNACDSELGREYLCWLLYHGSKSTTYTNKCFCIVFTVCGEEEEICQICNHYTVYELFACLFSMVKGDICLNIIRQFAVAKEFMSCFCIHKASMKFSCVNLKLFLWFLCLFISALYSTCDNDVLTKFFKKILNCVILRTQVNFFEQKIKIKNSK
jgi:hypothetical protein